MIQLISGGVDLDYGGTGEMFRITKMPITGKYMQMLVKGSFRHPL